MGADRTLMQVKVRCGLGRGGVLGRLYGNSRGTSLQGQTRKSALVTVMSAFPPIATKLRTSREVRFVPTAEVVGLIQSLDPRNKSNSGSDIPSALAVLRLTTSSNLVGCSMGISAGLPPRRSLVARQRSSQWR